MRAYNWQKWGYYAWKESENCRKDKIVSKQRGNITCTGSYKTNIESKTSYDRIKTIIGGFLRQEATET